MARHLDYRRVRQDERRRRHDARARLAPSLRNTACASKRQRDFIWDLRDQLGFDTQAQYPATVAGASDEIKSLLAFKEATTKGGTMTTIAFSPDAGDSLTHSLEALLGLVVDLTIPANTGYPAEGVCIVGVDEDGDLRVCETDETGAPLPHSTWAVPVGLIETVTVL